MGAPGGVVLVLGASGFIGARVALEAAAQGFTVKAAARRSGSARQRLPQLEWVQADFTQLTTPEVWLPLLEGVEAVINCVGVLQDAAGESSKIAHVIAPRALIGACERAGVGRFIHISAIGAGEGAGTSYARDKLQTELMLADSRLDWIVIRPSLVVSREVYGGTALIRGLAGLPGLIPLVGANGTFRPIHIQDLAHLVVRQLSPESPTRTTVEAAGPETVSLKQLVQAYRAWLGFGTAQTFDLPAWAAWPLLWLGDLAGWLGWTSPLRSTSIRQLLHGAAGIGPPTPGARAFTEIVWSEPAGVQDRWHARLYFVRPLAFVTLAAFWLISGLVALGPGREAATALLARAGFGEWSGALNVAAAALDIALAAMVAVRKSARVTVLGMLCVSLGYLALGSLRLPGLWTDPLGPWLKVLPVMALCLVVLATEDRR
jgi:uncharacterized protein YbjT (DUF2867 family)